MTGGCVVYLYLHQTCRQCYILSLWTGTVHCHLDNGLTRHVSRVTNFYSRMWVNAEDFELVRYCTHCSNHPPTHLLINVPLCTSWRHGVVEVQLHSVLICILDRNGWSPRPGRFTPGAHWIGAPSRPCGEDENLFCLSGIEPKSLGRLASGLVAILTEMFGLPLYNRNADKNSTKQRWYVGADVWAQLLYCQINYFAKMCELNCFGVNYM